LIAAFLRLLKGLVQRDRRGYHSEYRRREDCETGEARAATEEGRRSREQRGMALDSSIEVVDPIEESCRRPTSRASVFSSRP
jgi:hypothetical protein